MNFVKFLTLIRVDGYIYIYIYIKNDVFVRYLGQIDNEKIYTVNDIEYHHVILLKKKQNK